MADFLLNEEKALAFIIFGVSRVLGCYTRGKMR